MKKYFALLIVLLLFFTLTTQKVYAQEYTLTVKTENGEYVFTYPDIDCKNGEYKLKDEQNKIERIVANSYVAPKDAKLKVDKTCGKISVIVEKNGKRVNGVELKKSIDYALKNKKEKIIAIYEDVYADISKSYLDRCLNLRGKFSTDYSCSLDERKHNIELAVSKINGIILKSGEVFSFNKTVGQRTEENGFKNAKIIENGVFAKGLGGGVCQVSSTVYNALLLSGMGVKEYHPHSLSVSYVEKSFDAMVSYGWADLKFVNSTNGYSVILAKADGKKIDVEIYGVKNEYSYERESVTTEEIPFTTKLIDSEEVEVGTSYVKVKGKNGYKSEGYLKVYKNGKLIEKKLIRKDKYNSVEEVTLQGKTADVTS
ncbi:MAG TPA: hypothetical protein DDY82_00085 [Clostridiales bacterium]|nr:hypothetical protein [Clostridiales bacterium]